MMNWNNLQLYDRLPVNLDCADLIADVAKQVTEYVTVPHDSRYFI